MPINRAYLPHLAAMSTRLSKLAPLSAAEMETLARVERLQRNEPAKRELIAEGEPVLERRAILSGWACRQRILANGRRQILSLLLPGDLIGVCHHASPIASTTILTLTKAVTCPVPAAPHGSALAEAYARSAALDEHHLLAHMVRLGRLNAYESLADWLLETHGRYRFAAPSATDRMPLPLTQEMIADALGLTAVHVNRTLQALRRDGLLGFDHRAISFPDRERLEAFVNFRAPKVSADM